MNQVCKTFPDALHNSPACDIISAEQKWLMCPACGQFKVLRLLPNTQAKNLPVYCKRCHKESIVNIQNESQSL